MAIYILKFHCVVENLNFEDIKDLPPNILCGNAHTECITRSAHDEIGFTGL